MTSKLHNAFQLVVKGHFSVLFNEVRKRVYSKSISYGLQRDLNNDFQAPAAKIEIKIRPLEKEDLPKLLDTNNASSIDPRIITNQMGIVNANLPTCYVAVTVNNEPCYMQWLIGSDSNKEIKEHFNGVFPTLKEDEALLEGAFSNPSYRGLRIMPRAMALIAEKARKINARKVNTFVDVTNIASLKGCERSGFKPYLLRKDKWFLFNRTITFHPLSDRMNEMFYKITESGEFKRNN